VIKKAEEEKVMYGFCCTSCGWEQIFPVLTLARVEDSITKHIYGCHSDCKNPSHELVIVTDKKEDIPYCLL
jgi:hypothetical protein